MKNVVVGQVVMIAKRRHPDSGTIGVVTRALGPMLLLKIDGEERIVDVHSDDVCDPYR